LTSNRLQP